MLPRRHPCIQIPEMSLGLNQMVFCHHRYKFVLIGNTSIIKIIHIQSQWLHNFTHLLIKIHKNERFIKFIDNGNNVNKIEIYRTLVKILIT